MSAVYIILANNVWITRHLNIQISQGSAATYFRWGGRFYSSLFCGRSENAAVKELLKLVNIWVKMMNIWSGCFFMEHPVVGDSLDESEKIFLQRSRVASVWTHSSAVVTQFTISCAVRTHCLNDLKSGEWRRVSPPQPTMEFRERLELPSSKNGFHAFEAPRSTSEDR